ncbi:DNA polymerase alpha/epsilon subunit B-domain-containing protein [Cladochytrium replicatum]|nr:DNA polymerase alpha/epsilon subunit B-domain-containing protein [Cladochytrium replicatum]
MALRRTTASVVLSHDFLIQHKTYTQQYAGLYFSRLALQRTRVLAGARELWDSDPEKGNAKFVSKILDVQAGEMCYVIGTVYVHMPLKPNILDEIAREHNVEPLPPRSKYASEEDVVLLEDESGRLQLSGDFLESINFVTGIVVAVLGSEMRDGSFEVIDIAYPKLDPQSPLPMSLEDEDAYIAIVSGINIDEKGVGMEAHLMVDYLTGDIGCFEDQKEISRITRLVIAGNTINLAKPTEEELHQLRTRRAPAQVKYGTPAARRADPVLYLDVLLSELCSSLNVDVMPGEGDPASYQLPQQPMHFALFPKSQGYSSFHMATNPHAFTVDGVSVLGTSGQNLDDIFRYGGPDDRMEMAESMLQWGHICPTAPDTLWCFPFVDDDPFILKSRPHVLFIGNQPEYATRLVTAENGEVTRIILVPSFSNRSSVVIVNMRTLEPSVVRFRP